MAKQNPSIRNTANIKNVGDFHPTHSPTPHVYFSDRPSTPSTPSASVTTTISTLDELSFSPNGKHRHSKDNYVPKSATSEELAALALRQSFHSEGNSDSSDSEEESFEGNNPRSKPSDESYDEAFQPSISVSATDNDSDNDNDSGLSSDSDSETNPNARTVFVDARSTFTDWHSFSSPETIPSSSPPPPNNGDDTDTTNTNNKTNNQLHVYPQRESLKLDKYGFIIDLPKPSSGAPDSNTGSRQRTLYILDSAEILRRKKLEGEREMKWIDMLTFLNAERQRDEKKAKKSMKRRLSRNKNLVSKLLVTSTLKKTPPPLSTLVLVPPLHPLKKPSQMLDNSSSTSEGLNIPNKPPLYRGSLKVGLSTVKSRIRKGIPDKIRGKVWLLLGGVEELKIMQIERSKVKNESEKKIGKVCEDWDDGKCFKSYKLGDSLRENSYSQICCLFEEGYRRMQVLREQEEVEEEFKRAEMRREEEHVEMKRIVKEKINAEKKKIREETLARNGKITKEMEEGDSDDDFVPIPLSDPSSNSREHLQAELLNRQIFETIERDLPRTYPKHSLFSALTSLGLKGQHSLRRMLNAYSLFNPNLGYCQGMGFIAGLFLTFLDEESAFYLLLGVMNSYPCNMSPLYEIGMPGAQMTLYVADKLLKKFIPKLWEHFENENVNISMYCTQWFLTLYTNSFGFDFVTRVWDIFLSEGWKIVFRIMLALLKAIEKDLLLLDFEGVMLLLRTVPNTVDIENVLALAFKIPIKQRHLTKYSRKWEKERDGGGEEEERESSGG